MAVHEKGKVGAANIDLKKLADISSQGKVKEKVDIQMGPEDEYLNKRLRL